MKLPLTFTVGITTCFGEDQIITSINSLKKSFTSKNTFPIILIADTIPLSSLLLKRLKDLGVRVVENSKPSSLFAKQKQILTMTKTDLLILVQDDILYEKNSIERLLEEFKNDKDLTFGCLKNTPLKPRNSFEKAINVGTESMTKMAQAWNKGDNYLSVLGRVMAFRTDWLTRMNINKEAVSDDAYLYFMNKLHGGKFKCIWTHSVYFRNPSTVSEHLKKSSRFQWSKDEIKSLTGIPNIEKEYSIPFNVLVLVSLSEFIKSPISFIYYFLIYLFTRLFRSSITKSLNLNWESEKSTKDLII